jgi:hypothetical protein
MIVLNTFSHLCKFLYYKVLIPFFFYSSNSLFAIPANQEFVFIQTKSDPSNDRIAHMVNSLVDFCKIPNSDSNRSNEEIVNTFSTMYLETNGKLCWKSDIGFIIKLLEHPSFHTRRN